MDCIVCNGIDSMEEKLIRFCACDSSDPFLVENMPGLVCCLCGNKVFSGKAIEALDAVRNGKAQPKRWQRVAVFDFEE
jgi:hypothetical protein